VNIVDSTSCTKFHGSRFRLSNNVTVITSRVSEDAVLVLLTGGIYEPCRWHGLGWHDVHIKFDKDRFNFSQIVRKDTHTERRSHKPTFMFSK
jgi:hypothetical protein